MKFVDYKCPNCNGSVKFVQGDSFGTCESCGATLQIATETTDKLFRAFDLISVKRFVSATNLLNDVLTVDVKNGQAYLGLLLCDTECCTPLALATTKYAFANNPNYLRALDFLSDEQKSELIALCNSNQAYLANENKYPTPAMKRFMTLYNSSAPNGITYLHIYSVADFSEQDEQTVINYYRNTRQLVDEMISLYNNFTAEEKQHLKNFDLSLYQSAIESYLAIKQIVDSLDDESMATSECVSNGENYPTPAMQRFMALYSATAPDGASYLYRYAVDDFEDGDEESRYYYYMETHQLVDEMISLYDNFTAEEKAHLTNFDESFYDSAIDNYWPIKEMIDGLDDEPEETETLDKTNDANYGLRDYDYKLSDRTLQSYSDPSLNNKVSGIVAEIKKINYDIEGLGLFNGSKKRELKDKIKQLENQKEQLKLNNQINMLTQYTKQLQMEIEHANNKIKPKIDAIKKQFDSTPVTAFKRRKEIKEVLSRWTSVFTRNITSREESIQTNEKEIKRLIKLLK